MGCGIIDHSQHSRTYHIKDVGSLDATYCATTNSRR